MSATALLTEHARVRRAVLLTLSKGAGFALDVHEGVRGLGVAVDELRTVFAHLLALKESGLVDVELVAATRADEGPRRRFRITARGMRELRRLRVQ